MNKRLALLLICATITIPVFADNKATGTRFAKMLDNLLSHSVKEVDVHQAVNMPDTLFIDAREKSEYDVSHIKNAIWVGYSDFDLARLKSLSHDQSLVVYCSVGYRSEKITEQLLQAGFTKSFNLYGGLFEWVNQGKDVVNSQGETTNIHAFNQSWGKWLKAGNKVYQ